jgi:hypothetical protein
MRVLETITSRGLGFGLALLSAGVLIIACSEGGTPAKPSAMGPPAATAVSSDAGTADSHEHHHTPPANVEVELARIRQATAPFHRVEAALAAGYELGYVNGAGTRIISGCVAHPTAGAMGYHYFNKALIDDLVVDPLKPEGLVYAPGSDGGLKLAALEYVVPGLASNPPGVSEAPKVFGMDMVILVPAVGFYTLHAWVWGRNPAGMFAHWNPEVVCP